MSYIQCNCWPIGQAEENNVGWVPPIGWPGAVSNSVALTGLPALTVPVTIDEAAIFYCRTLHANLNVNLTIEGNSAMATIPLKRYNAFPFLNEIFQDEEHRLIPSVDSPMDFNAYYSGTVFVDLGSGDFISVTQCVIRTDCIWMSMKDNIAFFNLYFRASVGGRIDGKESGGNIYEHPIEPPETPGPDGTVDIFSGQLPLYGTDSPSVPVAWDFSFDTFTPTKYFRYAKQDGTMPTWDELTGAMLHPPAMP